MKNSNVCILFFIFCISLSASFSQAQVPGMILDQQNNNFGVGYTGYINRDSGWQSFTAGANGYLGAVHLWLYSTGTNTSSSGGGAWSAKLSIRLGEGVTGTLLNKELQPISGDGTLQQRTFILQNPVLLTAGQKYTIGFGLATTGLTVRASDNLYANGRCGPSAGYDYNFATYIIATDESNDDFKLTANDKAAEDWFGYSVSVAGNLALVGACYEDPDGMSEAGAAYLYERGARGTDAWTLVAKLTASDKAANDQFGYSVSVSGDVALVGACGAMSYTGAAYVFERNAGGTNAWGQVAKLTASDKVADDVFGYSVSVSEDVALVGANGADPYGVSYAGAAYVFERNAGGTNAWGQAAKLTASDKAAGDEFGSAVSLSSDVVLVGAYRAAPDGKERAGAAYLYERHAGGTNAWGQIAKLTASDKEAYDNFGKSVSLSSDVALIGASGAMSYVGAAYVFERNAGGTNAWGQLAKLMAKDKMADDEFGSAVSLSGDVALIGAYGAMSYTGAAYVFERNALGTNAWGELVKLTASEKAADDCFGYVVSLSGDVALIGAFNASPEATTSAGAAYIFENLLTIGKWSDVRYRDTSFSATANVISNAAQFAQFAWLVNNGETYLDRTVSLATNIDLAAHYWVPAGPDFSSRFEGAFDGVGRNVRNIRIDGSASDYQGLFGCVGADGKVCNIVVTNLDITGRAYVGGIAGQAFGPLSNCTARAGGIRGTYFVGGVAGSVEGTLTACTNSVDVSADGAVGGVAGEANGDVSACSNSGSVRGNSSVGGIGGLVRGVISDCANSGAITSVEGESTGGIVGSAYADIYRCTNVGRVEGPATVGGIVGVSEGVNARMDHCFNMGTINGSWAGGIASSHQGSVKNCANSGSVSGSCVGGIVSDALGCTVINCANSGEILGDNKTGGLIGWNEGGLLVNSANSGAILALGGVAGGLVGNNEGTITNCYWKQTGVYPFTRELIGTDSGTLVACQSFGAAPGTLAAPVTVGGVTTDRLSAALNAWVTAAWAPGCGLYSWTAGTATNYPFLSRAIAVGDRVIPQTLSDGFLLGIFSEQIDATVAVYTNAHPGTTAESLGRLMSDSDAMGFTFAELASNNAILSFSPGLAITRFDPVAWSLTFMVANGIDSTAVLAMNRLAASLSKRFSVLQMSELGGAETPVTPTVQFHADGTAKATFTPSTPPTKAFYKLKVEAP